MRFVLCVVPVSLAVLNNLGITQGAGEQQRECAPQMRRAVVAVRWMRWYTLACRRGLACMCIVWRARARVPIADRGSEPHFERIGKGTITHTKHIYKKKKARIDAYVKSNSILT